MAAAVLIPVYRGDSAELFDMALKSIESEVIPSQHIHIYLAIDGPLTPELEAVVSYHADHLHKIVRHDEHVGPSAAMHSLFLALDDEELIFRMDSDDLVLPGRFMNQYAYMDQHPDVHILGGAIEEYDTDTNETVIRQYPTDPDSIAKSICFACPIAHPTVCIRREVLRATNGYPQIRGQDLALWFKALSLGFRISNLDQPLVRMNVNDEFYRRRNTMQRSLPEFKIYMKGIWQLHGITWRYIYPISRLLFRLTGTSFTRYMYKSNLRNRMSAKT
jgi:hypothetical protein